MLLNEIFGLGDPIDRKRKLDAQMARMSSDYAPGGPLNRNKPSREVQADRKRKAEEYQARRQRVEQAVEVLANKYPADQRAAFEREARETIPAAELKLVDLAWAFDNYNSEMKAHNAASWEDYGSRRERGDDPMIHGLGTNGNRNWTGD